jgi:hypothetical protein
MKFRYGGPVTNERALLLAVDKFNFRQFNFFPMYYHEFKGERLRKKKLNEAIHSLNVELGIAVAGKRKIPKWQKLDAYGQYLLWLEKILLKNQKEIRK